MVTKMKREAYHAFAQRLLEACERSPTMPRKGERGFTKALGQKAGVGYKGAEKWIKGESMPDMANASLLAVKLNVPFEWLMTGRYAKKNEYQESFSIAESGAAYAHLSDEEIRIAKRISNLPDSVRVAIQQLIEAIPHKK